MKKKTTKKCEEAKYNIGLLDMKTISYEISKMEESIYNRICDFVNTQIQTWFKEGQKRDEEKHLEQKAHNERVERYLEIQTKLIEKMVGVPHE